MASKEPAKRIVAAKRIFDVAKPDESTPDATSRPIIGHKTVIADPMVSKSADNKPEVEVSAETKPDTTSVTHTPKVINPISEAEKNDESSDLSAEVNKIESTDKAESAQIETTDDTDVVDAVADQANKKTDAETEVEKQKQAELKKLIEDKKYYLTIDSVDNKRNTRIAATLLLITVLVGLFLVADAGVINLGFKLPFHIIK